MSTQEKRTIERYEKVRADWLLAHELSWTLSDRRMANELKRRAARKDLNAAGAAESAHHEGKIKPIWSRFLAGGEDSKDKMFRGLFLVLFVIPGVALGLGPALMLSQAAYKVTTDAQLTKGQVPTRRAWFIAGGALAAVGAVLALLFPSLIVIATARFYPDITLDVHWGQIALVYGFVQVVLALLLTGWEIRRHGWPGVTVKTESKLPEVPKGDAEPAVPKVPAASAPAEPVKCGETADNSTQSTGGEGPKVPALPAPVADTDPETNDEPDFDEDELIDVKTTKE